MKKFILFFIGIVVVGTTSFSNILNISQEYHDIIPHLSTEQKDIFYKLFDTQDKLIDSYKLDILTLNKRDINYEKKIIFYKDKLKTLEQNKELELDKLKKDFYNNPERYTSPN